MQHKNVKYKQILVLSFIMAIAEGMAYIWSGAYGDIN